MIAGAEILPDVQEAGEPSWLATCGTGQGVAQPGGQGRGTRKLGQAIVAERSRVWWSRRAAHAAASVQYWSRTTAARTSHVGINRTNYHPERIGA